MERGGCASLRSLPCCPLLSRSRTLRGMPRPGKPPQRSIPTPPLAKKLRSYICSQEKRYCVISKTFEKSHFPLRVFSTHEPQEANLSTEETRKDKFLIDCENDQECVVGGIVALGKFDALHIGHRELAIQASKAGIPFLLSFVGMAEVLGWEFRSPIVAKCDRKRVLTSWAPYCGNIVPLEFQVEFSNVRHLTPRQFVERLSMELRISGVVAGENYRFGYKASGDAPELLRLCNEYGLSAYIVKSVMDKNRRTSNGASTIINPGDRGQVSSSRVRYALATGDMEYVEELLGRKHRLVLKLDEECQSTGTRISAPKSCMLNQPPKDGMYVRCTLLGDDFIVGRCNVTGMLSFGMFGVPMVGADICGFNGNTTEELCRRWMQLGAFYPFTRNHAVINSIRHEPYIWPSVAAASKIALGLRYRLLPYLYTLMYEAHVTGAPIARPLFFSYPEDPATYNIETQFLLGDSIIVSPVLTPGAVTVDAYFPPGRWYNLFDYTSRFGGGRTVTLEAPAEAINVHVRGGTVLAMQDAAMTTAVARESGFELLVVLSTPDEGRNAIGELFMDDGETVEMGGEGGGWTRVKFSAEADGNGAKVKGVVENGGYALEKKLIVKKVVFLGLEVKSTGRVEGLKVNGERRRYTRGGRIGILEIGGLSQLIGKDFELGFSFSD